MLSQLRSGETFSTAGSSSDLPVFAIYGSCSHLFSAEHEPKSPDVGHILGSIREVATPWIISISTESGGWSEGDP